MTIKNGDLPAMPNNIDAQTLACMGRMHTVADLYNQSAGLTKREQFAMAALQGILSCDNSEFTNVASISAVAHADALLAELEKSK